ncbi:MAG: TRAP transporter TatT component family protein [Spirochaetaceae bacterium]|jgi:predicted anti-sigma-YlaC factor YlaD|nr:TRAP transporter TatT component family protein [Spirochaetaceae bacterium]
MKNLCLTFAVLTVLCSCSINKMAINALSDALTGDTNATTFTGDADPDLVGDALPFAIKLYETLLAQNPNHQGLILTTGSLFIMYANAFVQGPAQLLAPAQQEEQQQAYNRAKQLYLRGTVLLYAGLDKKYPGFSQARAENLGEILVKTKKEDVALLYWTAAGTLSAYSFNVMDPEFMLRLSDCLKMVDRAYALDPDFNKGAIDELYILLYASLPETNGGDKKRAQEHFERAIQKSHGLLAGPYITYAQSLCIPAQDYDTFKLYLEKALALDPQTDEANRLINTINQRKAQYLLTHASRYFYFIDDEADGFDWTVFEEDDN